MNILNNYFYFFDMFIFKRFIKSIIGVLTNIGNLKTQILYSIQKQLIIQH